MGVTGDMARAIGFEGGYGQHTTIEEILALIEGKPELALHARHPVKHKPAFPFPHDKRRQASGYAHVSGSQSWTASSTSPRGGPRPGSAALTSRNSSSGCGGIPSSSTPPLPYAPDYLSLCDESIVAYAEKDLCPPSVTAA
jgi:hypothetical protein